MQSTSRVLTQQRGRKHYIKKKRKKEMFLHLQYWESLFLVCFLQPILESGVIELLCSLTQSNSLALKVNGIWALMVRKVTRSSLALAPTDIHSFAWFSCVCLHHIDKQPFRERMVAISSLWVVIGNYLQFSNVMWPTTCIIILSTSCH